MVQISILLLPILQVHWISKQYNNKRIKQNEKKKNPLYWLVLLWRDSALVLWAIHTIVNARRTIECLNYKFYTTSKNNQFPFDIDNDIPLIKQSFHHNFDLEIWKLFLASSKIFTKFVINRLLWMWLKILSMDIFNIILLISQFLMQTTLYNI